MPDGSPYSQLEDKDHVGFVLENLVQLDDVAVQNLLQDVHLPLNLLSPDPTATGPALPFLDELGRVVQPRCLFPAPLHDGKLPTASKATRQG